MYEILLVSRDEKLLQDLKILGYTVSVSLDSDQILNRIQEWRPLGCVIVDLETADSESSQLLAQLKSDLKEHLGTVMVITAADEQDRIVDFLRDGVGDYALKPTYPEMLKVRMDGLSLRSNLVQQMYMYRYDLIARLSPILLSTAFLIDAEGEPIGAELLEMLNNIEVSANRMLDIIKGFTQFVEVKTQRLPIYCRPLSLTELVQDVLANKDRRSINEKIMQKRQVLSLELPENIPLVYGDSVYLGWAIESLLANACQYTPEEDKILVELQQETIEGLSFITFSVQDSGIGIKSEDSEYIFTPFFRATDFKVRQNVGLGLGLAIARHIVEMHGGYIGFESVYGQGSTFYFRLPVFEISS